MNYKSTGEARPQVLEDYSWLALVTSPKMPATHRSTILYRAVRIQRHYDLIENFEVTLPRLHIFFQEIAEQ